MCVCVFVCVDAERKSILVPPATVPSHSAENWLVLIFHCVLLVRMWYILVLLVVPDQGVEIAGRGRKWLVCGQWERAKCGTREEPNKHCHLDCVCLFDTHSHLCVCVYIVWELRESNLLAWEL